MRPKPKLHPLTYRCPHGLVQLRSLGKSRTTHDMSEEYVIESDCSCNGTHPDLNPGWRITGRPRNDAPALPPTLLVAAE